ncbi:hypothetical protein R3W88_012460 [Solanum pinnatisectum]|uniref:Alginate lyase 2 domain-containing protein n=1 Tax=Solanum pinnatisectum TaxID=50273 RepID=A0AAV9L922_9SOLN|nr:hypothetical protein R3W88_012460 [Solanum pinnatisectum]
MELQRCCVTGSCGVWLLELEKKGKMRFIWKKKILFNHRLWVYADDKPYDPNSLTQPRTEIRIQGLDYWSGIWQFEGSVFVPNGTSGSTIVQIHGASHGNTTIILRIYDGDMSYYNGHIFATGLCDKWFKVNLIHDVDGGKVAVFIDGKQIFETKDKGPGDLHFKCGVYAAPDNISYYME